MSSAGSRIWPERNKPAWFANWIALNSIKKRRIVWDDSWDRWEVHGYNLNGTPSMIYVSVTTSMEKFLRKAQYVTGESETP